MCRAVRTVKLSARTGRQSRGGVDWPGLRMTPARRKAAGLWSTGSLHEEQLRERRQVSECQGPACGSARATAMARKATQEAAACVTGKPPRRAQVPLHHDGLAAHVLLGHAVAVAHAGRAGARRASRLLHCTRRQRDRASARCTRAWSVPGGVPGEACCGAAALPAQPGCLCCPSMPPTRAIKSSISAASWRSGGRCAAPRRQTG